MELFNCISLKEAVELVTHHMNDQVVENERIPLTECLGRIVAKDMVAQEDLPAFHRSTVDGFAVNSADTFGASESAPVLLNVIGEVMMGQQVDLVIQPGEAMIIPTGGMLPVGANGVVMFEYTERVDGASVLVMKAAAPGENMIAKGEDIAAGIVLVRCGCRIFPQDVGALACCGYTHVPVFKKPIVGIISTGDEVVDIGCAVTNGQIRDINSYSLSAMLQEMGCRVERQWGIVPDSYDELQRVLSQALDTCHMVLVSGGSSVGTRDHTVSVIQSFEQSVVLFHGIAMKPGKPTIFGMVGQVPVFGLPGHPVSAMVVCREVVKSAVFILTGQQLTVGYPVRARMTRSVASAPGRDDFIRVRLFQKNSEYWAEPVFGKSGLISVMMQADGIVHITSEQGGLYQEELVEVEIIKKT